MGAKANASAAGEISSWHALSADEVAKRLATNVEKGLDAAEASTRLQTYGPNRLPEGMKRGPFMRFLAQFNNILVYVLLGAGFTKLMLSLWVDAAIIFAVVVLNGLLGFIQEGRAEKALDSIRNMLSAEARTVRGGETRMLPADELVPGDIVLLELGEQIFRPTCGSSRRRTCTPRKRRSPASWCRRTRTPTRFQRKRRSGTASAWLSPARWWCWGGRRGSSSRRAVRRSSAASTSCSQT